MLILYRTVGESFWIGDHIKIKILRYFGDREVVRVGVQAPEELMIWREESRNKFLRKKLPPELDNDQEKICGLARNPNSC